MQLLAAGATELGISLSPAQMKQFLRYYEEMVAANSRVNLTSVTEWEAVQRTHFLDSLAASRAIPKALLESRRFVDVGSGAGFPGVPLKIAFPGMEATLIEATRKKAAFLEELRCALGLHNVDVRTGRAETLAHDRGLRESFDLVLARGVASMAVLAELTLPFCRVGGIVVAQKGPDVEQEVRQAERSIRTMGGGLKEISEVALDQMGNRTGLVVLEKVGPTPERYPRRPGMPKKRPL